jgi:hypothetical protein
MGTAAPALAETVASARAVPPAATPAAWDRKRRRDVASGMGVLATAGSLFSLVRSLRLRNNLPFRE